MKITLKKAKVTQIINEEIEKILIEQKKFKTRFESLELEKVEKAKKQETFKEILAPSSVSKI